MTNPIVDIEAAGGICPDRLEKSIGLIVRPADGPGQYLIRGGKEPHMVDLHDPQNPRCDCGDHLWREKVCAHILAALYFEGDERVISAVQALVQIMRAEINALTRVSRHFQIRLTASLKAEVERQTGRPPEELQYIKSAPAEIPHITVLGLTGEIDTGEVLGTISTRRPDVFFCPSVRVQPSVAAA